MMGEYMKLSIIIPMLNEAGNVSNIYAQIKHSLKKIKYEIIFVNDGSVDNTETELNKIYKADNSVKIIHFSRNFGKDAAIYAGMKVANAPYTAIIDGDMQQHPKYLMEMYNYLEKNKNCDQVCMVPAKRKNMSLIKGLGGKLFYRLINHISGVKFRKDASDFRMFRNNVKEAVLSLTESNRFSKGLFNWVGFNTHSLTYQVEPRKYGKTKFNLKKSFNYALIGIIDYAENPLNMVTKIGILSSLLGFGGLIYLIIKSIIIGHIYHELFIVLTVVLIFLGINLLGISFICLYLARMQAEIKKRPIYIIKETKGIK